MAIMLLGTLFPAAGFSQQDPEYSQYMFNGLAFNPAYAGSRDALSMALLYRQQWVGIDGAPETQTFSAHTPLWSDRHAIGLSVVNDQVSYLGQTWFNLDYAFRIQFRKSTLAFGLRATANYYRIGWESADIKDPRDVITTRYARANIFPNAGFGMFYYSDHFYVGASVPRLLVNDLSDVIPTFTLNDPTGRASLSRHYYATTGVVIPVGGSVDIKPSVLVKYIPGIPYQADLNLNIYFDRKVGVGFSYRTGDGIVGLLDFQITPQLRAGYAYDYPLSALNGFTSGSHELMVGYDFVFRKDRIYNPRLF